MPQLAGGMVIDAILKRKSRSVTEEHDRHPEARLQAIWTGAILVPAGLLIYGFCIAKDGVHWLGAVIGIGIACFGLQVITTICYTYSIDCYQEHASEVSQLFNFIRQEIGMTFAFYAVILGDRIGFQYEMLMFAGLGSGVALALMLKGARWRARLE
ncbi:hypothetical protein PUNSTDRAFT_137873 [Punctularia strigosozonata HHB-11173 SS5]|uniref:MFS general substrate transporter n=1 Tax=Punctularia strigosozonata (strain HHB-11173) TaxID=741275 RepID=R7S5W8_PUNST|nr:uncharacterized protein PUNSTDRAFT_137873 [Punctularia strigosozonata HHB-11173 SS5]EIN05191.1 hypothetical protein PUNSTDRAFT_137873 [Punctularia strigosozonata HHB-11173 SS5]